MTDAILSTPAKTYERIASASNEVAARLAARLREETQGEVLFTPSDRGRYATDASIYQVIPLGVFVPRDTHEVGIAMDICRDLGVPIVPRGGGTSQCGQTTGAGLVIDYSKYVRHVLHIDTDRRTAEVEPGLVLDHLNAELKSKGFGFQWMSPPAPKPPSAAWRATTHVAAARLHTATWCTTSWVQLQE